MDNLSALKAIYSALGGESETVLGSSANVDVLNGISTLLGGEAGSDIAEALEAISLVAGDAIAKLQNKTVTPSTSKQTIKAGTGYNGLGTVTVNAVTADIDANIIAGNIKNGITILGITGTYTGD